MQVAPRRGQGRGEGEEKRPRSHDRARHELVISVPQPHRAYQKPCTMRSEQGGAGTFTHRLGAGQPEVPIPRHCLPGRSGPLEKGLGLGQESGGPERPRGGTFPVPGCPIAVESE